MKSSYLCLFLFIISINLNGQNRIEYINPLNSLKEAKNEIDLGNNELALSLLESIHPNDSVFPDALTLRISILYSNGDYETVTNIKNHITPDVLKDKYLDVKIYQSVAYIRLNQFKNALKILNNLEKKYNTNYLVFYNSGICYDLLEEYPKAVEYYKKAITLNPLYANSHYRLGFLCLKENLISQAMLCYNTYLLLEPESNNSLDRLREIDIAVSSKKYRDLKGLYVSADDSAFRHLDLIINNYVALNENYPIQNKINFNIVKQNHALLNKLLDFKGNKGFWDRYYVSLYKELQRLDYFDSFIYRITASSTNKNYVKDIEKGNNKSEEFVTWFYKRWPEIAGVTSKPGTNRSSTYFYYDDGTVEKHKTAIESDTCDELYEFYHDDGNLWAKGGFANDKRNGLWVWYYPSGKCDESLDYKNGEPDGEFLDYHENGNLYIKTNYQQCKYNGEYLKFDKYGSIIEKSYFKFGNLTDTSILFYPLGKKHIRMKIPYINDTLNGIVQKFYPNGSLEFEIEFKNGLKVKEDQYFQNGEFSFQYKYKDNTINGNYQSFYDNGQIYQEGLYKADLKFGKWFEYYRNGQIAAQFNYNNFGKLNGPYIEYNRDSVIKAKFNYTDGLMDYYIFYDDGSKVINEQKKTGENFQYTAYKSNRAKYIEGTFNAKGDYDGVWKYYSVNGFPYKTIQYKDGELTGNYIEHYANGSTSAISQYTNGNLDGYYLSMYIDSAKHQEGYYIEGNAERFWRNYYPDGSLSGENYYFHNNLHKCQTYYSVEGKVSSKYFFDEGNLLYVVYYDTAETVLDTIDYFAEDIQQEHFPNGGLKESYPCYGGKIHGKYQVFYYNGKLRTEGEYFNGELHGEWKWYNSDGVLVKTGTYFHGQENGVWIDYFDDGKVKDERQYFYGKRHGIQKSFYENGQLENEIPYFYGVYDGTAKFYDSDGTINMVRYYDDDIIIGHSYLDKNNNLVEMIPLKKETGKVTLYFPNGQISREFELVDGKFNGAYKQYYQNGNLESIDYYTIHVLQGKSFKYFENGKVKTERNYVNDFPHGKHVEYHENGKIKIQSTYIAGKLSGMAVYYSANGDIKRKVMYVNDEEYFAEDK